MARGSMWQEVSRERIRAAEDRLRRLREVIERRARLGLDTGEGWRLFGLTATLLATMRRSEELGEAFYQLDQERWTPAETVSALHGAEPASFAAGAVLQVPDAAPDECHLVESGVVSLCFGHAA